ncbi:hypothetical protein TNCV_1760711 [Trichonephila clavipes]|nr:hypothetical protein TNCV_1760711 [Trichonephila clavipes]
MNSLACLFYRDLSPIGNMWSMLAQRLVGDTALTATPYDFHTYEESAWTSEPPGDNQTLSYFMLRRVTVVTANYTSDCGFCHYPQISRGCDLNHFIFVQHDIFQINFAVIPPLSWCYILCG